jgi:hypothetical protein
MNYELPELRVRSSSLGKGIIKNQPLHLNRHPLT